MQSIQQPTDHHQKVAVVGAGPIGLALALLLSQRGFKVDLYEKRSLQSFIDPPDDTRILGTVMTQRGY